MTRHCITAIALLALLLSARPPAHASAPLSSDVKPGPWTANETFVWSKLQAGEPADLGAICPGPDPSPEDNKDKRCECRKISAGFLRDVLTRAPWREAVPSAGVEIHGARITGDLDLENARLVRALWIFASVIEGDIMLRRAHTESVVAVSGSVVSGTFNADGMRAGDDLLLRSKSIFKQDIILLGARIDGQIDMTGTTVLGTLNADGLQLGQSLHMSSDHNRTARFKNVNLNGAKIDGQIVLLGATVSGIINGDVLHVGQSLLMRSDEEHTATFQDVNLIGAKIEGQIDLTGATISGKLDGDALQVGHIMLMHSDTKRAAKFKDVILRGAKIDGELSLMGATVSGTFDGDSLQVEQALIMRADQNHASTFEDVNFTAAKFGIGVDIRGATLGDFDLSQGTVTGELRLGSIAGKSTVWQHHDGTPGTLSLRNTQIGTVSDDLNAWPLPDHLALAGFSFAHVGGSEGLTEAQMRGRGMVWWDQWARRDREYSPTPYVQLAAAFIGAGDRNAANAIRFLGRERERETAWQKGEYGNWLLQTTLSKIAGYGIGTYTFYVLRPVLALTLIGAYILRFTVPDRRRQYHGALWCFGASLSRVLPVVEINKEFTEFFNDPKRDRLYGWQSFTFSALGVFGWILGGIFIAALAGLTQNP